MLLTAEQIARYTGGTLEIAPADADALSCGITWDSREVEAGYTYLALPGENVDGHSFIVGAIDAGACVVVGSKPADAIEGIDTLKAAQAAYIRVDDAAAALTRLAACWRDHLTGSVIALTGSSGKTTTKNLVRDVLGTGMETVATKANQNNELGVPRTLLAAQPDTRAVVVEMGMRGLGQLDMLCTFVKPTSALITNVGTSHVELLGSRENIARAKAEPLAYLPDGSGTAFLNASDEFTPFVIEHADVEHRDIHVVLYDGSGKDPNTFDRKLRPDVYAADVVFDDEGCASFTLVTPAGSAACSLQLAGSHNVANAAAAAAVAWHENMTPAAIASALHDARPEGGRQRVCRTASGARIIDDTYNANPDSMRAALKMFASLKVEGKRYAVLGDMGELGDFALEGHTRVGNDAAAAQVDELICIGSLARTIAQAAIDAGMPEQRVQCVDTIEAVLDILTPRIEKTDAVLVKASHSMHLERIVEGLVK